MWYNILKDIRAACAVTAEDEQPAFFWGPAAESEIALPALAMTVKSMSEEKNPELFQDRLTKYGNLPGGPKLSKRNYKLLAVDLDDTMLNSQLLVPEQSRQAVVRAREAGVRVTLATGRMFRSALPFAQELGVAEYLMTYQGALVKHAVTGDVLFHRPVPLDSALEVLELVNRYGYHINVYVDDTPYIARQTKESELYTAISRIPMTEVGNLAAFLRERGQDPTKIVVVAREELIDSLLTEVRPRLGNKLHITKSKPNFLEFSHPLGNKGDALAAIAAHYGVAQGEVIAVGDGYNDLEMIDFAGLGVVVGNARPEIKEHADYVCRTNDECGVAEVVEKFILTAL
ncbi:Cof-type HAD-IIB family hydrolase [Desulfoscipio gibsoniae]